MLEKMLQMTTETKNNFCLFFGFSTIPANNSHLKSSKPQKYKHKHKLIEIEYEREKEIVIERKHSSNDAIVIKKNV